MVCKYQEFNMTDEKNNFDQLGKDELKDVRGGIPYEPPVIVELSADGRTCGVGIICKKGTGTDCRDGQYCSVGAVEDPLT
jgi:hypothetical protein